jgi:hypothetical protein
MQQFWNEFCCHSFHTQNISKNVMRWANRYADFSYCDSPIIHNHFFHFFRKSIIDMLSRPETQYISDWLSIIKCTNNIVLLYQLLI